MLLGGTGARARWARKSVCAPRMAVSLKVAWKIEPSVEQVRLANLPYIPARLHNIELHRTQIYATPRRRNFEFAAAWYKSVAARIAPLTLGRLPDKRPCRKIDS